MVRRHDIITVPIAGPTFEAVKAAAAASCLGGRSAVRPEADRQSHLHVDQLVGRAAEAALSIYVTGSDRAFRVTRRAVDRAPHVGDGGSDLLELEGLDVKGSLDRNPHRALEDYHLVVRPSELRPGTVYVLGIVTLDEKEMEAEVHLVGWIRGEDVPEEPNGRGPLAGACVVKGRDLHPLLPMRWI